MNALFVAPTSNATLSVNIATDTTTRADTNNIPFNTLSPGNSLSASPTIRLLIGRLNTIAATHSQKLSSNAPCSMTSL